MVSQRNLVGSIALRNDFKDRYFATCPGDALCGRGADEIYLDVTVTADILAWLTSSLLCRLYPRKKHENTDAIDIVDRHGEHSDLESGT